jgi:hypothetical protein
LRARTRPSSRAVGLRAASPSPQQQPPPAGTAALAAVFRAGSPASPPPPPQPLTQSNALTQEELLAEALAEELPEKPCAPAGSVGPAAPPAAAGGAAAAATLSAAEARGSLTPNAAEACFALTPGGPGGSVSARRKLDPPSGFDFGLDDGAIMGGVSDLFLDDSLLPTCEEQLLTDAA